MSPHSLSLSLSLSLSIFLSPSLTVSPSLSFSHLGECACSLKSKPLPVRLLRLCALRYSASLSFLLCAILHCTALHCSSLLSSPSLLLLFLPSLSFSTCIPLSLHSLISVVHCCALLHCLGKYCTLLVFLRQS